MGAGMAWGGMDRRAHAIPCHPCNPMRLILHYKLAINDLLTNTHLQYV
jgi:hypothetical protein